MKLSTLILLIITLVAFATNSILCRQALMTGSIGPIEFTVIRLASGMVMLIPIVLLRSRWSGLPTKQSPERQSLLTIQPSNFWPSLALSSYALFFSLAYIELDASVGALILFASVQLTMIGLSILQGNRVTLVEWTGIILSFCGLLYLLLPGLSAPPIIGTLLMMISGISWGVYSLLGKRQTQPILATARNFLFCLPVVAVLGAVALGRALEHGRIQLNGRGFLLALLSGGVASGLGYILWYVTVRRITTTVASISQLVVPIFAAVGGILLLGESVTLRLVIASIAIAGGVVITILGRKIPQAAADQIQ